MHFHGVKIIHMSFLQKETQEMQCAHIDLTGVCRVIQMSCYVVLNANFSYCIQWKGCVESHISCNIQR